MSQSIGVVGHGVLGSAIVRGFTEHADVKVFDIVTERSTHPLSDVATCDFVFIALPTPSLPDGRCDTRLIDQFLHAAYSEEWWSRSSCYTIRSTVNIGYTERMFCQYMRSRPLLHSPEFLTARCSLTDFQCPARNIVGTPSLTTDHDSLKCLAASEKLAELYARRFPGVPVHRMHSNGSELVKLACNTFFAAKVTMFNLFAEIATAAGVDWETVRGGILSDGRIAHAHTAVAPDSAAGFGGTCVPGSTMIRLYTGSSVAIADLEADSQVASVDALCETPEMKHISKVMRRQFDGELITFHTPRGDFSCTPDHLMPIHREGKMMLVKAENITLTDCLLAS